MYAKQVIDPHNTHVKVGVGVIVVDDRGWVLLEKRSDNALWGLPVLVAEIMSGEMIISSESLDLKIL